MTGPPPTSPALGEVRLLCRRARAAGAPNGPARPRLVNDYRRLCGRHGVEPVEVRTGQDLLRACAALLRVVTSAGGPVARGPGA